MQVERGGADDQRRSNGSDEVLKSIAQAQISATSQQQLAGMEQIAQAVESINQAGAQSVEGTRQVEQEVSRLEDLSQGLKRLVQAELAG